MNKPRVKVLDVITFNSASGEVCSGQVVFSRLTTEGWVYHVTDGFDRILVPESNIIFEK